MKTKKHRKNFDFSEVNSKDFISIGLSCHAICLLQHAGILNKMLKEGKFENDDLKDLKNPHLVKAAFATLIGAGILQPSKKAYRLTQLGRELAKDIGGLMLPFVGYRKLLEKQYELLDDPTGWQQGDIDYSEVARASIDFGLEDLDPVLLNIFKNIQPRGTICDLGCGTAEKLTKICKALNANGLGIEKNRQVVKASGEFTKHCKHVEVIQGDITKLKGIWEDVEIVMISFVLHDIDPSRKALTFLRSIRKHFPRLRCLIVVDIVSPSEEVPSIMPGFDYVHGLQGVTPRDYRETLQLFSKAEFNILEEVAVPNMPNTFVWLIG